MDGKERQRAAIRRLALQQLGVDPEQPRGFVGQAGAAGTEGAMARLPATMLPQVNLFDEATGDTFFMVDFDEIDSPTAIIQ